MIKNIYSKYPIAIDIESKNIYALQLKPHKKVFNLRGWLHTELVSGIDNIEESENQVLGSIREIVRSKIFSGKKVSVLLPFREFFTLLVRFKTTEKETLEQAIVRESATRLPFPVDQAVIDYSSLVPLPQDDPDQYMATIVAVKRESIDAYLSILKQGGLDVEVIDSPVSSLARLHHHLYDPDDEAALLCHLGDTQSLFTMCTKDRVIAQHTFTWGMESMVNGILTNLETLEDRKTARKLIREQGLSHEKGIGPEDDETHQDQPTDKSVRRAVYQIITPYVEELINEFHHMIGFLRSQDQSTELKCIYFYGHARSIKNFERYVEARLHYPVKLVDPMERIGISHTLGSADDSELAGFDLALGLGFRKISWP